MEGVDTAKRFEPCFLCQVFCGFDIFNSLPNMGINFGMVFDDDRIKRLAVAILGARDELFFVKSKQCCVFLSFSQKCWVQGEDSRFLSCFFKNDLFRLDVGDGGFRVQSVADTDNVCCSRCCALEDRL